MKRQIWVAMLPFYLLVGIVVIGAAKWGSEAETVIGQNLPLERKYTVIIDPGHGYPDGGATSCTGVLESTINLQIAKRLDDLMHFLGVNTVMIRLTDESVYTEGESIGEKKVSDLKQRVRIVNETEGAILVSIHQNTFPDRRYGGPQVLYGMNPQSRELAQTVQSALKQSLDPLSKRVAKKASGVYLMEHINCTGILIECGFISNPEEEAKLLDDGYQKQLCCVVAAAVTGYLFS